MDGGAGGLLVDGTGTDISSPRKVLSCFAGSSCVIEAGDAGLVRHCSMVEGGGGSCGSGVVDFCHPNFAHEVRGS